MNEAAELARLQADHIAHKEQCVERWQQQDKADIGRDKQLEELRNRLRGHSDETRRMDQSSRDRLDMERKERDVSIRRVHEKLDAFKSKITWALISGLGAALVAAGGPVLPYLGKG